MGAKAFRVWGTVAVLALAVGLMLQLANRHTTVPYGSGMAVEANQDSSAPPGTVKPSASSSTNDATMLTLLKGLDQRVQLLERAEAWVWWTQYASAAMLKMKDPRLRPYQETWGTQYYLALEGEKWLRERWSVKLDKEGKTVKTGGHDVVSYDGQKYVVRDCETGIVREFAEAPRTSYSREVLLGLLGLVELHTGRPFSQSLRDAKPEKIRWIQRDDERDVEVLARFRKSPGDTMVFVVSPKLGYAMTQRNMFTVADGRLVRVACLRYSDFKQFDNNLWLPTRCDAVLYARVGPAGPSPSAQDWGWMNVERVTIGGLRVNNLPDKDFFSGFYPLGTHKMQGDTGNSIGLGMDEEKMRRRLLEERPSDAAVMKMMPPLPAELSPAQ